MAHHTRVTKPLIQWLRGAMAKCDLARVTPEARVSSGEVVGD